MHTRLSPHFRLSELTLTRTGLPNQPDPGAIDALRVLCTEVLEPWREAVGPLRVSSGFRSEAVNTAVGGVRGSQHARGEAADIVPLRVPRVQAWSALLQLIADGLPVDQAIVYETTRHIHVSHTTRHAPRGQLLVHVRRGLRGRRYVAWHDYTGPLRA